jgi:uncharacterized membrane protein
MSEPKFKKTNTMKAKPLFGLLLAVFTIALFASFVVAAPLNIDVTEISIDGSEVSVSSDAPINTGVAVFAGESFPVRIEFTANENSEGPLEISAWIQGAKGETEVTKLLNRDLIDGSHYNAGFSVFVPSDLDDDDEITRDLTLVIRIESDEGSYEQDFDLEAQRKANLLNVLLVDFDSVAKVDSTLPVTIVLKNTGSHKADDTFVTVSIPALGTSKTVFFSDLFPVENCDEDLECGNAEEDNEDTLERRVFLTIPNGVAPGIYEVAVTATSDDAETTVIKPLSIVGSAIEGQILANPSGKTFAVGQTATYEMILVNTGNKIGVYNLVPQSNDALTVSLSDVLTTVPAGSSKTVLVDVTANREGTFNFGVTAVSDGFSETALYSATVEGRSSGVSGTDNNFVALTVVLAIIFVVLLIILIVLLTRKPEKSEEFGESYY